MRDEVYVARYGVVCMLFACMENQGERRNPLLVISMRFFSFICVCGWKDCGICCIYVHVHVHVHVCYTRVSGV